MMGPVQGRKCGTCRLCCKTLAIWEKGTHPVTGEPYEFKKPAKRWCEHASPKGCAVHDDQRKPFLCRFFHCFWLRGFGTEEQRPDRCRVVVAFDVIDTTERPDAMILAIHEELPGRAFSPAMAEMYNQIVKTMGGVDLVVVTQADLKKPRLAYGGSAGQQWRPMFPISPDAEPGQPEEPCEIDAQRAETAELLGRPDQLDLNYSIEDVERALVLHSLRVHALRAVGAG